MVLKAASIAALFAVRAAEISLLISDGMLQHPPETWADKLLIILFRLIETVIMSALKASKKS